MIFASLFGFYLG